METVVKLTGRQKVLSRIETDLFFKQISNREVANTLNVHHSTFSNKLYGRNEFDCTLLLKFLRYLYPNDVCKRRAYYWMYYKDEMKPKNVYLTLELSNLLGELPSQKRVLAAIKRKRNKNRHISIQTAKVYELLYLRSKGEFTPKGFINEFSKLRENQKSSDPVVRIISQITYIYTLFDNNEYKLIINHLEKVEREIQKLNIGTLKKPFELRIKELFAFAYLYRKDLKKSREYCMSIINDEDCIFPKIIANAYLILGQSYIFSNYKISKKYLEEGIETLKNPLNSKMRNYKIIIEDTLAFLKIHWRRDLEDIKINDDGELAYFNIIQGNTSKALTILHNLKIKYGRLSAFQLCYLGFALKNKKYIEESKELFLKSGNFFFAKLPEYYLNNEVIQ